MIKNNYGRIVNIASVSGKDGNGNNLLIALSEEKKIYFSRDGGYNWFKYGGANNYRERQYGYSGLTSDPNMNILGLTYAKGTWIICGENSKVGFLVNKINSLLLLLFIIHIKGFNK